MKLGAEGNEREKAAGIDGVNGDLVRLLVEDSRDEPTPLLRILVVLINQALTSGITPLSAEGNHFDDPKTQRRRIVHTTYQ